MASYGYTSNRASATNGNGGGSDHVCRPVLVDAQGRRTPLGYLTSINGLQGYVVKAAEGVGGVDQLSEPMIRGGGGHGHHHAYASDNAAADEDQDFFEKIRKEVSRPKSWNNVHEQSNKYVAAAASQQLAQPYFGGRQTIDSEEARRRYGRWGAAPPPQREYYGTIDSRDATKRYGGVRF